MSLEKSTKLKNITLIPFVGSDVEQILDFVQRYDSLYGDLGKLETQVQEILKAQEILVNELKNTRNEEEVFFERISAESGVKTSSLKQMAAEIANNNKAETFLI